MLQFNRLLAKSDRNRMLLATFVLLGTLLRLYHFQSRLSFEYDNSFFAWEAKKMLVDHKFTLIGQEASVRGLFIGPLYTYLSNLFYWIFNMDPVGGGYLAILFGVLSTLALFKLGDFVYNQTTGLIAAAIYQFSTFTITWDSGASPLNGMFLIPTLWFYTLLKLSDSKYLTLHFIILGLGLHFHPTSIILLLTSVIYLSLNRYKFDTIKQFFIPILSFFFTTLPLALFDLRHNFRITDSLVSLFSKLSQGGINFWDPLRIMLNNPVGILGNGLHLRGFYFFPIFLTFAIISYRELIIAKVKLSFQTYILLFMTTTFSLLLYPGHITDYYPMVIYAPTVLIWSLIMTYFIKHPKLNRVTILSILILAGINFYQWVNFTKEPNLLAKKQIVDKIISHSSGRRLSISPSLISSGYNTGFDYLFWRSKITLDPNKPQIIYSIVIPPRYLNTTPQFQTGGVGLVWDEQPLK